MNESFFKRVYALVKQVPKGKVVTYGQVAAMLGNPRMSRQDTRCTSIPSRGTSFPVIA